MEKNNNRIALFTGTATLATAGILSRIIGFFYKIFLSRTIGAEGLGIYQLIFPVMAICFALTSAGIQTSISRFVSRENGIGNLSGARCYLLVGLCISVFLSFFLGLFLWNYADIIATIFLGEPRCAPMLKILAFSYLPCSIHSCINGYYYGLKKAFVPSLSQLIEQIVRILSIYFIYLIAQSEGRSISFSLAIFGIVFGEIAGMLVALSAIGFSHSSGNPFLCAKSLLQMAVPLTLSRLILTFSSCIENILIPYKLRIFGYSTTEALSVYGILTGMAISIILFPTVLTNSVSVLLLPVVSEAQSKNNRFLIKKAIKLTVESCLLLGSCCSVVLLLTGNFIGNFIFRNALAGTFITTLCWICPFLYLTNTLNSIFHGLGKAAITLFLNLLSCAIRIVFISFLVPIIGIKGYLTGLFVSQCVSCVSALVLLYKSVK